MLSETLPESAFESLSLLPEALAAHSSAQRIDTPAVVAGVLRKTYPDLQLTITPRSSTDLLGFARSGHANAKPIDHDTRLSKWSVKGAVRVSMFALFGDVTRDDAPPPERKGDSSELIEEIEYGAFLYSWKSHDFVLFVVKGIGSDSGVAAPHVHNLMRCVSEWMMQAGKSVLVFDDGRWRKDTNLWKVTQSACWENVVLREDTKEGLRSDVEGFFDSEALYKSFAMPWKRGTIFHGPPGNGKTLVIQTLMKTLSDRPEPIPTLYVKTFVAEMGPQWSVSQIFSRARATAPCLLVFEDIDSMVTEKLRSYFLNEVDGLESNDGIYMLGTTNHLDRLDPSLAQRPSRFDRKVCFEAPSRLERTMYAMQWKNNKLSSIRNADFPEELCEEIADATDGFSFAYLKELFVATFLGIAREGMALTEPPSTPSPGGNLSAEEGPTIFGASILRSRIMAQVEILRVAISAAVAPEGPVTIGKGAPVCSS